MSKRSKSIRRRRYYFQRYICQDCGSKHANYYWLPDSDPAKDPPDEVLCPDHAKLWYCLGCGNFCAGQNSFDFVHPGYCDNCAHEIQEGEDDEYEYWDGDDSEDAWCDTCQNMGTINCHCGGDLCVCENHGEMPCPNCDRGL